MRATPPSGFAPTPLLFSSRIRLYRGDAAPLAESLSHIHRIAAEISTDFMADHSSRLGQPRAANRRREQDSNISAPGVCVIEIPEAGPY